jgi:hypothetical protein
MASPVGERDGQVKRPRCVGLIFLPTAALALTAMLAAGCGGGGDPRPKVEASLRHYFSTLSPEESIFPTGAGPPRVKDNGCKDLHRKSPEGPGMRPALPPRGNFRPGGSRAVPVLQKVALWQCFVRFKNFTLTVQVAVNDSTEVVWAWPVYGDSRKAPKLSPARTYTG